MQKTGLAHQPRQIQPMPALPIRIVKLLATQCRGSSERLLRHHLGQLAQAQHRLYPQRAMQFQLRRQCDIALAR